MQNLSLVSEGHQVSLRALQEHQKDFMKQLSSTFQRTNLTEHLHEEEGVCFFPTCCHQGCPGL